ncbi:MAG: hypothetical protein V3U76_07830 [Granulosicoccus sp.]
MKSNDWLSTLIKHGLVAATPSENARRKSAFVVQDAWPAVDVPDAFIDLSSMAVIDVYGADARDFLQGQFCNNIAPVSIDLGSLNGYCNPKGRLLALPVVLGLPEGYRLLLPVEMIEVLLNRLRMFVMRADVQFEPRNDLICSAIQMDGKALPAQLSDRLPALPSTRMQISTNDTWQVLRWHDWPAQPAIARWLCIGEVPAQTDLIQAMADSDEFLLANENLWRLGNIQAGLPEITEATYESFVPQMVNLQQLDALSFSKGCYPGQEIVARMQYLGKLKRHMLHFSMKAIDAGAPDAGALLVTDSDAAAGQVVSAVAHGEFVELLAVVKTNVNIEALSLGGQPVELRELPYSLTPPESDSSSDSGAAGA